ncbi:hypothetical protein [Pseudomonas laurylsulfatiphila]|uniref:hypothetical protein n=1 Tax=Pseudomonas laurylsulfatiphila TaxID=2011015 RepID=UPI003D2373B4
MAHNLKLNSDNDIIIGRGTSRVAGLDFTIQLVKNRLLTVLGEWKADSTLGLPWFSDIMIKAPDLSLVEGLLLSCIKNTPHVLDVISINLQLDKDNRVLNVSFEALSDWGLFESNVPFGGS